MRRAACVLISTALLACLISAAASLYFTKSSGEVLALVDETAAALERGDSAQALAAVEELGELWSTQQHIWEILTKHSEVDEASQALVRLRELCRLKKLEEAMVECAWLKSQFWHIPHSESFRVENFL